MELYEMEAEINDGDGWVLVPPVQCMAVDAFDAEIILTSRIVDGHDVDVGICNLRAVELRDNGLTKKEDKALKATVKAFNTYVHLPDVDSASKQEFAQATNTLQMLLGQRALARLVDGWN